MTLRLLTYIHANLLLSLGLLVAQPQFVEIRIPENPIPVFGLFEMEADINTSAQNPFDYDQAWLKATITAPSGTEVEIDGFYYQHFYRSDQHELIAEGQPHFRIRYTPQEIGTYQIQLHFTDIEGTVIENNLMFLTVMSDLKSFVKQSDQNLYLEHDQGETVFLVGQNMAWAGFESGTDRMHLFMERLHEHGGNFAKLMLVPWSYKFEWIEGGLRNYFPRQNRAFMIDSIFSMARNYGMYMQLAFAIHNELRYGYPAEDWTSNPYNQANGGPCADPVDFFSNADAKAAFRNKLRYIIARWAYEPHLVAWELMSEADNFSFYKPNSSLIAGWINEMADFIQSIDPYQHLVSVGFALLESNPVVWQHESIDFTQIHFYRKDIDLEGLIVRQNQLYLKQFDKPMLAGEFDLGHFHDSLIHWDPTGLSLHNTFWSTSLSGSFGAAVPWFWDKYIDELNLYPRFSGVASFMNGENLARAQYEAFHLPVITSIKKPFHIEPHYFDLIVKSPSNEFSLEPTGMMIPGPDSLGMMLYGPNSVFQMLRNPPTFQGDWHTPAIMSIEIGSQVFSSRLQVKINENVVFEQDVQAGNTYSIEIPTGQNRIHLDNVGTTFTSALELDHITFHDYLYQLRAFGLVSPDRSLVWVHNRDHHWAYLSSQEQPPEAVTGQLILPYNTGLYEVAWHNTSSGIIDSTAVYQATNQGLALPIASLSTDLALKASMISNLEVPYRRDRQLLVYPNPSDRSVTFTLMLDKPDKIVMEIFDITGRNIYNQTFMATGKGMTKFDWKGVDMSDVPVSRGLYFYRIRTASTTYSGKLLRN